jgi:hypothetical protein
MIYRHSVRNASAPYMYRARGRASIDAQLKEENLRCENEITIFNPILTDVAANSCMNVMKWALFCQTHRACFRS